MALASVVTPPNLQHITGTRLSLTGGIGYGPPLPSILETLREAGPRARRLDR